MISEKSQSLQAWENKICWMDLFVYSCIILIIFSNQYNYYYWLVAHIFTLNISMLLSTVAPSLWTLVLQEIRINERHDDLSPHHVCGLSSTIRPPVQQDTQGQLCINCVPPKAALAWDSNTHPRLLNKDLRHRQPPLLAMTCLALFLSSQMPVLYRDPEPFLILNKCQHCDTAGTSTAITDEQHHLCLSCKHTGMHPQIPWDASAIQLGLWHMQLMFDCSLCCYQEIQLHLP